MHTANLIYLNEKLTCLIAIILSLPIFCVTLPYLAYTYQRLHYYKIFFFIIFIIETLLILYSLYSYLCYEDQNKSVLSAVYHGEKRMKVYNALLVKNTYMLPLPKAALNLILNNMKTILKSNNGSSWECSICSNKNQDGTSDNNLPLYPDFSFAHLGQFYMIASNIALCVTFPVILRSEKVSMQYYNR